MRRKRRSKLLSIVAPSRGDLAGCVRQFKRHKRRLAEPDSETEFRDIQIRSEEAAYPLIEEHERLAVQRAMDLQLSGDLF